MSKSWLPGVLDTTQAGGWALAHFRQGFLADSNGVLFPRDWLKRQDLPAFEEHGLGHFDGDAIYLLDFAQAPELPGCTLQGLRQFMMQSDADTFRLLGYAAQIATWADNYRFCGSCGTRTQRSLIDRSATCPNCEVAHYPRLSPSMIVLVTRGDEILLARSPRYVPGMYSTLAGFVEAGESVENCVAREVREEVGVEIKNIQYLGSQGWPFPHSLMLGFHAEYASGEIVMQEEEIEDAQWFKLDNLPPLPFHRSIARYLIEVYLARRSGQPEPVLPG
ncbi:NAD(+) diphosphatase [Pseudomonas sp. GV071]|jgi:NAD+ diphosphatase|uniref:NAD(+) diphosphatase n=1 Tax=Pseudomonas sp. GV071 TaxID=2135754 RepID=UPI000D3D11D6|nr:NAD(+) diphosphatase [Pseudomonas sp. GV071]PTQ73718.1 NAD+ diphosphatase [Pseudomonas sp. GV071]